MPEFYDFEVGSFDVQLTLSALITDDEIRIKTDTAVTEADGALSSPESTVKITRLADGYRLALLDTGENEIDRFEVDYPAGETRLQVTGHDDAISVFMDDAWLYTFTPVYVHYEIEPTIEVSGSSGITIIDGLVAELYDCRDALDIDLQNSMLNAASSVLGQKPIKVWSTYEGIVCYAYDPPADEVQMYRATTFERVRSLPNGAASDVLVMHQRLAALVDLEALEEFGLMTRLVRAPELGAGAIRVGQKLLENSRQEAERYMASGPIDPRIEMYDRISAWVTTPGAAVGYDKTFIVDSVAYTGGARPGMRLEGNRP